MRALSAWQVDIEFAVVGDKWWDDVDGIADSPEFTAMVEEELEFAPRS